MRHLTTDELSSEVLHRLALRRHRTPTRLDRDLVHLIVEVVDLAREPVPDCYVQATLDPTPPTAPARGLRPAPTVCEECDGAGYIIAHPWHDSFPHDVPCPSCQGKR